MSSPPSDRALPWRGRLLALSGILLAALNLRTAVTSLTPLLDVVGAEFGFGATITGVIGLLPTAAFALFGVATPAIARRIGLEATALLAMGLATAGLAARAGVGGTGGLMLASGVALAGMGIGNVVLPPLVKRYFADHIGRLSAIYITVLQLGTMLPALAAVPAAAAVGWRLSLGLWGLVAAAAMLPWAIVLASQRRGRPHPARQRQDPAAMPTDLAPDLAGAQAPDRVWRTALGWGLAFMFGMTSLITYAMFTWLPLLFVQAGGSPTFGGQMLGLFSATGLVLSLAVPPLAARMRNPMPIVLVCATAQLAGFAGLLLAPMSLPALWVTLIGIGVGTFPLGLTLINLRTRTPAGSSSLSGFMQGVGYTVACLGPLLFGLLHEATADWLWPFAFLTACTGVLVAGGALASRSPPLEDVRRH